ncbi:unnamed protein product [Prorocentrum cordatum]|uniref:Uncharacterized protein n=1 Tax=Prorocentrum cordatum TaxID=2364126 RepID=A0ABN9PMM8_9DINO|nr:unnamed protein product [Polarella glacialis]
MTTLAAHLVVGNIHIGATPAAQCVADNAMDMMPRSTRPTLNMIKRSQPYLMVKFVKQLPCDLEFALTFEKHLRHWQLPHFTSQPNEANYNSTLVPVKNAPALLKKLKLLPEMRESHTRILVSRKRSVTSDVSSFRNHILHWQKLPLRWMLLDPS